MPPASSTRSRPRVVENSVADVTATGDADPTSALPLKRLAPSSNDDSDTGPTPPAGTEINKRAKLSSSAGHSNKNPSDGSDDTITTPSPRSPSPAPDVPNDDIRSKFSYVDHVPSDALDRAAHFAAMRDPANGRYNVTNIPPGAKWGTKYDTEKYLCDKGNRKLTVWMVGVVKTAWFTTAAGDPVSRINVSIRPVRIADMDAFHLLLGRSQPAPDRYPDRASASRFQTRKVKGSAVPQARAPRSSLLLRMLIVSQAYPFDRVYNATKKFKGKSQMAKFPPGQVGNGDFVLVEAFVNRYKTSSDGKGWTTWNVTLELNELSVVFEAPEGFIDTDDETPTLEVDDDI